MKPLILLPEMSILRTYMDFMKKVTDRLYARERLYLYQHVNHTRQVSPADIRIADDGAIEDVLFFDRPKNLPKYRTFLHDGDVCFLGYLNEQCIHRTWVVVKPKRVWLHWAVSLDLQQSEAYIHFSETAPSARGRNIYAHILSYITTYLTDCDKIYICVNSTNKSSIRSIEKAGFILIRKIFFMAILNTLLFKKESLPD